MVNKELVQRPQHSDAAIAKLFNSIPPEIANSFTTAQLAALKQALSQNNWTRHPVDIRMSVPFPRPGFYLVFLAGRERRSPERRQAYRNANKLWTWNNSILIFSLVVTLMSSCFGAVFCLEKFISVVSEKQAIYPTAIPWISDAGSCQKTGRTWENSKCLDFEHSSEF